MIEASRRLTTSLVGASFKDPQTPTANELLIKRVLVDLIQATVHLFVQAGIRHNHMTTRCLSKLRSGARSSHMQCG